MKLAPLAFALALAACAAPPLPVPPIPPEPACPRPVIAPPPAPSVESVTRQYAAVSAKEAAAVIAPAATADFVRAVHAADLNARRALRALERQGRHPKPATLETARAAVRTLADLLG